MNAIISSNKAQNQWQENDGLLYSMRFINIGREVRIEQFTVGGIGNLEGFSIEPVGRTNVGLSLEQTPLYLKRNGDTYIYQAIISDLFQDKYTNEYFIHTLGINTGLYKCHSTFVYVLHSGY